MKKLCIIGISAAFCMSFVSAQAADPSAPNDAQIAHIVVTANTIDVDYGKIAVEKTNNVKVKEFAETMIRDHSAVNKQASELAAKLGVTPADNDTSKSLVDGSKTETEKLNSLSGAEFDKEYVTNEVNFHTAVIDALDKVLLPNTSNSELKALLEAGRPIFIAHLEHAKMLQSELAK